MGGWKGKRCKPDQQQASTVEERPYWMGRRGEVQHPFCSLLRTGVFWPGDLLHLAVNCSACLFRNFSGFFLSCFTRNNYCSEVNIFRKNNENILCS